MATAIEREILHALKKAPCNDKLYNMTWHRCVPATAEKRLL